MERKHMELLTAKMFMKTEEFKCIYTVRRNELMKKDDEQISVK